MFDDRSNGSWALTLGPLLTVLLTLLVLDIFSLRLLVMLRLAVCSFHRAIAVTHPHGSPTRPIVPLETSLRPYSTH